MMGGGTAARYKPFGGYAGGTPANYIQNRGFTGHDRTQADDALGVVYMNARVYMPSTGKFLTPDTLVPDPANSQSYNRYAYVHNNPINFTDPSGHCRYDADGDYTYATNCTVEEFERLSWDDRIQWVEDFMQKTGVDWFWNIVGILEFFRDDPIFSGSDWASWSDAGVLFVIQQGWRVFNGEISPRGGGGSIPQAALDWANFFSAEASGKNESILFSLWAKAEQAGVDYGLAIAKRFRDVASDLEKTQIDVFVGFGNLYRAIVGNGSMLAYEPCDSGFPTAGDFMCTLSDALLASASQVVFDPRKQSSRIFVREFSQMVVVPLAWNIACRPAIRRVPC